MPQVPMIYHMDTERHEQHLYNLTMFPNEILLKIFGHIEPQGLLKMLDIWLVPTKGCRRSLLQNLVFANLLKKIVFICSPRHPLSVRKVPSWGNLESDQEFGCLRLYTNELKLLEGYEQYINLIIIQKPREKDDFGSVVHDFIFRCHNLTKLTDTRTNYKHSIFVCDTLKELEFSSDYCSLSFQHYTELEKLTIHNLVSLKFENSSHLAAECQIPWLKSCSQKFNNLKSLGLEFSLFKFDGLHFSGSKFPHLKKLEIFANKLFGYQNITDAFLPCIEDLVVQTNQQFFVTRDSPPIILSHLKSFRTSLFFSEFPIHTHLPRLALFEGAIMSLDEIKTIGSLMLILSIDQCLPLHRIPSTLASSLKALNLSHCELSDIQNLGNLRCLKALSLESNHISTIGGLESLTELEDLNLSCNFISKIDGLGSQNKLISLNLEENQIFKVENLECLEMLESLQLRGNCIKIMENIKSLSGTLKKLSFGSSYLEENSIDLSSFAKLKELAIESDSFSNIDHFLRGLKKPREPLARSVLQKPWENLEVLFLENYTLNSLPGMEWFKNLKILHLKMPQLSSMKNFDFLEKMKELSVSFCHVTSIREISKLHNLEEVEVLASDIKVDYILAWPKVWKLSMLMPITEKLDCFLSMKSLREVNLTDLFELSYYEFLQIIKYHAVTRKFKQRTFELDSGTYSSLTLMS